MSLDEREPQDVREAREAAEDPIRVETMRVVRRVGYAVFFPLGLAIFIPAMISVGQGIQAKEVWDPYTGQPVLARQDRDACIRDAHRLVDTSRGMSKLNQTWERAYHTWVTQCRDKHGDLYEVLRPLRTDLRKRTPPAETASFPEDAP